MQVVFRILLSSQIVSVRCFSNSRSYRPKLETANSDTFSRKTKHKSDNLLKNLYPWKTKKEFVEHLAANIVYNQDGLVAINKPFGVPLQKNKSSTSTGPNECPFSLEEVLIPLASFLNYKQILPAKMTERFASGISLFTTHEEVDQKIKKSFAISRSNRIPPFKYLAVTIGEPKPPSNNEKIGMGFLEHKDVTGKLPILMKDYSKKNVTEGLIKEFEVMYQTLTEGKEESSLVELQVFSIKNHFLRVYLAYLFSPILGDHLYGNRVQNILGKRLAISPVQADRMATFQKIPDNILKVLNLTDSAQVPTCLHLNQLTLTRFANRDSNLVLTADPLPYFKHVCNALDLYLETNSTVESKPQ